MQKKFPNVLPINTIMIDPRVKSQAGCQVYCSRALKWGIVHLSTLDTFRDTMKFRKLFFFSTIEKVWKWISLYLRLYLLKNKCQRDAQYLILKLLSNCFDILKSNWTLGVHFFYAHTLCAMQVFSRCANAQNCLITGRGVCCQFDIT